MASHTTRSRSHRSDPQTNNAPTTSTPAGSNTALEDFEERTRSVEIENARLKFELAEAENELLRQRQQNVAREITLAQVSVATAQPAESMRSDAEPRVGDPPTYKGKTIKEHGEWFWQLNNQIERSPRYFPNDQAKIAHAKLGLREGPADFIRQREETGAGSLGWTYEQFKDELLDLVQHPSMRGNMTMDRYSQARQKPHQTVQDFDSYLGGLESMLDDDFRREPIKRKMFMTKLVPGLQQLLGVSGKQCGTRAELVAEASRLEQLDPERQRALKGARDPLNRSQTSQGTNSRDHKSRPNETRHRGEGQTRTHTPPARAAHAQQTGGSNPNNTPVGNRKRVHSPTQDNACFYCKELGHWKDECPKKNSVGFVEEPKNGSPRRGPRRRDGKDQ